MSFWLVSLDQFVVMKFHGSFPVWKQEKGIEAYEPFSFMVCLSIDIMNNYEESKKNSEKPDHG